MSISDYTCLYYQVLCKWVVAIETILFQKESPFLICSCYTVRIQNPTHSAVCLGKLNCGKQTPEAWATSTFSNDATHTNQSGAATLHLASSVNFLSQSLLLLKDCIDFIWCLMLRILLMNRWMRLSIPTPPPPQKRGKRRQLWERRIGTPLTSYLLRRV